MQILYHFPHVVTENFKPKYNAIKWLNNSTDFENGALERLDIQLLTQECVN